MPGRTTPKGTQPPERVKPKNIRKAARSPRMDLEPTSAENWQGAARRPVPLELPSGNVVLAINRGMKAFMKEGKVPNALMPLVQSAIDDAKGVTPKEVVEQVADPETLGEALAMIDDVVLACVKTPVMEPAPLKDAKGRDIDEDGNPFRREESVLYLDEMEDEDRMFIFQWVIGGTDDVEQFRKEQAGVVGDIRQRQAMAQETE